jgi:hypothetical protein
MSMPMSAASRPSAFLTTEYFVVRGGIAHPASLIAGAKPHNRLPGISGISVQSWPGVSVEHLARAGGFPNLQISVATFDAIRRAGFEIQLSTPGAGRYHGTVILSVPLPLDMATVLSSLFVRRANPSPAGQGELG